MILCNKDIFNSVQLNLCNDGNKAGMCKIDAGAEHFSKNEKQYETIKKSRKWPREQSISVY